MDISDVLSEIYGTNQTQEQPTMDPKVAELSKEAQVELFLKLAEDNKIDLNKLSEEQIQTLFNETFNPTEQKTAEAPAAPAAQQEQVNPELAKVAEAAEQEWLVKRAYAEKFAEADAMGRTMAHALVNELNKIAGARESASKAGKADAPCDKDAARPAETAPVAAKKKGEEKKASAMDILAGNFAVAKLAEAGWPVEEAVAKIEAVLTLGAPQERSKMAAANSFEGSVEIRALELCDLAGFPVEWKI